MNETLPDHITDCIREYYKFPNDTTDVDTLINLRKKLAGLKFGLSVSVGVLYKQKNSAEYSRKAEFYRIRQRLISEGASAAKAESEAQAEILELMDLEQQADAEYRAAYLILESAGGVLDTMNQHIANLRSEKRVETFGQGSQG